MCNPFPELDHVSGLCLTMFRPHFGFDYVSTTLSVRLSSLCSTEKAVYDHEYWVERHPSVRSKQKSNTSTLVRNASCRKKKGEEEFESG